jgi:asparagine synthase (glutamine-hydrolysing)
MCGIIGAFRQPLDIDAALDAIAHRGPDGRGHTQVGDAVLGHTRLAIQDTTAAAAQPFRYGPVTLTYNGEAWNAADLKASLPGPWTSTGDTEAVAALLAAEGWAGLDLIDGMFAIAWTDDHGTWLARDRYGKVPLYVARRGSRWLWASEIKALPFGARATAVRPGTAVHLDTGVVRSWVLERAPAEPTPGNVRALLRDGVRDRLLSDRPVCFLLSGGLDSTFVLALAKELHPDPVAYTAVYDPDSADLRHARLAAAELDVPLVEVKIPAPTYAAVTEAVRCVEVPMKAQVEIALANLPLARAIASDGFRVALSGEAADELFGGYGNMCIAAAGADDEGWRGIRRAAVEKMGRGNFARVNKVFMAAGVEARLPFMHRPLVDLALAAGKDICPPGKKLLKAAAAGLVPDAVIRRPKDTFQGGTGIAAAAAELMPSPARYYNAEARSAFGWLPRG